MPFICIGPICIPWNIAIPGLLLIGMPIWNRLPESWRRNIEAKWSDFAHWFYATFPALDFGSKSAKIPVSAAELDRANERIRESTVEVVDITAMEVWETALKVASDRNCLVVIKFSAEWCKPCKRITPLYEALAKEYAQQYIFTVVDVDDLPDLAVDCGAKVLPTFQVYQPNGERLHSMSGADEGKLKAMIAEYASRKKTQ